MLQFYLLPNEVQTYQKSRSSDHWSQSFSLDLVHGQIRVLDGAYIEEIHYNPVARGRNHLTSKSKLKLGRLWMKRAEIHWGCPSNTDL